MPVKGGVGNDATIHSRLGSGIDMTLWGVWVGVGNELSASLAPPLLIKPPRVHIYVAASVPTFNFE